MKIDLHCHTRQYSGCGKDSAEKMIEAALEMGLHGIVFTDHDVFQPKGELKVYQAAYPDILILGGIELSLPEGHLLVYGLDHVPQSIDEFTMEEVLDYCRPRDCFCAVAHPFRYDSSEEHFALLSSIPLEGVEVVSNNTNERGSVMANELAETSGLVRLGSSDAHEAGVVGLYYTVFEDEITSGTELIHALWAGRCRPSHEVVVHC